MGFPKVLIATPTYRGKDYCTKEFIHNVRKIVVNTPGSKAIIVDNSDGKNYVDSLQKRFGACGVEFHHVERGGNSRQAITNSMNYARKYAIDNDYQYMLVLEIDLFPKDDIIYHLFKHQKLVVGAFYMIGTDDQPTNPRRPCLFVNDYKPTLGVAGTRVISPSEYEEKWRNTGVKPVHGMGLGCVLIHRDIFTKFPFWYQPSIVSKHHDVYFYMDMNNNGIQVFCDTDIEVLHLPSKWTNVGDV